MDSTEGSSTDCLVVNFCLLSAVTTLDLSYCTAGEATSEAPELVCFFTMREVLLGLVEITLLSAQAGLFLAVFDAFLLSMEFPTVLFFEEGAYCWGESEFDL